MIGDTLVLEGHGGSVAGWIEKPEGGGHRRRRAVELHKARHLVQTRTAEPDDRELGGLLHETSCRPTNLCDSRYAWHLD